MTSFSQTLPPYISVAPRSCHIYPYSSSCPSHDHVPPPLRVNPYGQTFINQYQKAQRLRYQKFRIDHPFLSTFKNMTSSNPEDMEEFQRLSDRYQPEVEGPLVSQRLPIADVVAEYAQADPTFITKTRALAGLYDNYRRIKGDGQCGWRGTVFGYFELLAKSGDVSLLEVEEIRIRSFKDIMVMAGVDYDLLMDMFDNTWELFAEIKKTIQNGADAELVVMNTLNDPVVSESIVYHFKMMTSSYMVLHADDFEPFLEMPLDEYRQTRIDPTNQEIDQIGLQALTTGVIMPAGIGLEVLYLDRSAGDMVTPHAFVEGAQDKPNIRLLYRPGHYDIIYKNNSPLTVMLQWDPQSIRTSRQFEQPGTTDVYSYMFPESAYASVNMPPLGTLPSQIHGSHSHMQSQQSQYDHLDESTHFQSYSASPPFSHQPSSATQAHQSPAAQSEYFSMPQQDYTTSNSTASLPTSPVPARSTNFTEPQIRLNSNMFRHDHGRYVAVSLDPRHVGSFAQSPASFCNPDFQPEIWNAKSDYNK